MNEMKKELEDCINILENKKINSYSESNKLEKKYEEEITNIIFKLNTTIDELNKSLKIWMNTQETRKKNLFFFQKIIYLLKKSNILLEDIDAQINIDIFNDIKFNLDTEKDIQQNNLNSITFNGENQELKEDNFQNNDLKKNSFIQENNDNLNIQQDNNTSPLVDSNVEIEELKKDNFQDNELKNTSLNIQDDNNFIGSDIEIKEKEEDAFKQNLKNLHTNDDIKDISNVKDITIQLIKSLKRDIKLKDKIEKRKISDDLLIKKVLSREELAIKAKEISNFLKTEYLPEINISEDIVILLVSIAYYEGFNEGGYWKKVFEALDIRYSQSIYLFLVKILKNTLTQKKLFVANEGQWAYITIMTHTIVPLEGGNFFKFLDFIYSFYTSLGSNIDEFSEENLKSFAKKTLLSEKDSNLFIKGTKLAIQNSPNTVLEYFLELLRYIDIIDSQKLDDSELANIIKIEINDWYNNHINRGFYSSEKLSSKQENDNLEEDKKNHFISNVIKNPKFTCLGDSINIEIPQMIFEENVSDAFIKIGENKFPLGIKRIKDESIVISKKITRKSFDFKNIKFFINNKLTKEWNNKVIFLKENEVSLNVEEKNNIYLLKNKKIRILFSNSYEIFSSNNEGIRETYITNDIRYADLYLEKENYYLKKGDEILVIKHLESEEEEAEIIFENDMFVKNISIEKKPVLKKQPFIFIPYTELNKYKVLVNDDPIEVKAGFNIINYDISGKYSIKIIKGIKNTKDMRVIRKEREYFFFKDLDITFYNETGDKQYLYSHREKKPVGCYSLDSSGISKILYNNKEIEKVGNTFEIVIDNGFQKEFDFQLIINDQVYNAKGKVRILEWTINGKDYYSEYNKNILFEEVSDKILSVKMDNTVGDILFHYGNEVCEKNRLNFRQLNNISDTDMPIWIEFRIANTKYTKGKIPIESIFKVRKNTKVKELSLDQEKHELSLKVRGKIDNLSLQIIDINENIVFEQNSLTLDNTILVSEYKGTYKVRVIKIDPFSFYDDEEIIKEEIFVF